MGDLDQLSQRVAAGDRDAFAAVFDALVPEVDRLVRLVVPDPVTADAVVVSTFVGLWRDAPRDPSPGGAALRARALAEAYRRARQAGRR
jgi:RNA polymerase sigma-70 factor (ECF subfamily)